MLAALSALARAVDEGTLDLETPRELESALADLRAIPGIGDWTAQYVAMRALGEPDGFPASDLGLKHASRGWDLAARSENWRPWRAYAALHLWAGLDD